MIVSLSVNTANEDTRAADADDGITSIYRSIFRYAKKGPRSVANGTNVLIALGVCYGSQAIRCLWSTVLLDAVIDSYR